MDDNRRINQPFAATFTDNGERKGNVTQFDDKSAQWLLIRKNFGEALDHNFSEQTKDTEPDRLLVKSSAAESET
jgi:hypothetical protein